ncbi:MAG TPA: hypothetical protein VFP12_15350 [Allosphingosinicella sp.]|nr:hypothetical protein [Allosphingosinicella sp.]
MIRSPPLRFLAIVLGGWAALRTALIAPSWPTPPADTPAAAAPRRQGLAAAALGPSEASPNPADAVPSGRPLLSPASTLVVPLASIATRSRAKPATSLPSVPASSVETEAVSQLPKPRFVAPPALAPEPASAGRWSLSAWAFVRQGDAAPLAAGGLLGGSQAGARLIFRLNRDRQRPLAVSARLSAPLRRPAGSEAALGLDWRPARRLPVHLLAERRQALGREGRSAFALTLYGGASEAPIGRFRLDAYAQAGVVGARSLDPYGDGSARLSLPLGDKLRLGAGAWAAAQPGLNRLDLGPQAALRLPLPGRNLTLAADWRLRVAGSARPSSGPTLTLSTDF